MMPDVTEQACLSAFACIRPAECRHTGENRNMLKLLDSGFHRYDG
ncbi:MAG: hypothetical protein AB7S75_05710 [Desulfococcaceae bacterium]